jgi:hypothetical protein
MRRVVLASLVCASCNQFFGLTQAREEPIDGGSGSNIDASCGGAAGCACVQHSDCHASSNLCAFTVDPDLGQGSDATCADPTTVAYVVAGASAGCTQQAPCGTVTEALATGRPNISVSGTISDNIVIAADAPVAIYGVGEAVIESSSGSDVLTVSSQAVSGMVAKVQLADLSFTGATAGNGVTLDGSGATVAMLRDTINNNAGFGISETGDDELILTRSTVKVNNAGGIDIEQGGFTFTNDFVVNNGNPVSGVRGGVFVDVDVNATGNRFEYNTVAGNIIKTGVFVGEGLTCNVAVDVLNSIVSDNSTGGSGSDTGMDLEGGGCRPGSAGDGSSFIGPDDGKLYFSNPMGGDYHLGSAGSVAIGAGKMDAIVVDVDGNSRPQQPGATDQGANEFPKTNH